MNPSEAKTIENEAKSMFNKLFTFTSEENWCLPMSSEIAKEELWSVDSFMNIKHRLNAAKSLLNDKGETWQKHTAHVNKAGLVRDSIKNLVKPDFLTQAWCKFYEVLASFPLIPSSEDRLLSFHMCEAPGAFISALNYYININCRTKEWDWYANTLNPYYEGHNMRFVVVDDRLLFRTLWKWHFGEDNTGDVIQESYLDSITKFFLTKGPVHLVTADGSIDCTDNPGEQELTVAELQFSEVIIALNILTPNGNFVVKKFTFFENISICTMFLLNCLFEKIHVFKPATSKSGNSEVYVVCLKYQKHLVPEGYLRNLKLCDIQKFALFSQIAIPSSFLSQVEECCNYFCELQISSITENVLLFESMTLEKEIHISEVKEMCVELYIHSYGIEAIPESDYRKLYKRKRWIKTAFGDDCTDLKQIYFKSIGSTYDHMELYKEMPSEKRLVDVERRLHEVFPESMKRSLDSAYWVPVWKEVRRFLKMGNYSQWVTMGKKFMSINNSKFCNPLLIYLWNQLIENCDIVVPKNHKVTPDFHWEWDSFVDLIDRCDELSNTEIILHVTLNCEQKHSWEKELKEAFKKVIEVQHCGIDELSKLEDHYPACHETIFVDTTLWYPDSFHSELQMKEFVSFLMTVIKTMKSGDCLILVLPSLLTRFTVGILFMTLSFFSQVSCLLPVSTSATLAGQMWLLTNFNSPLQYNSLLSYMDFISNFSGERTNAILEVAPMFILCGGYFYEYILEQNCKFMLSRLRRLIEIEKVRLKNGKCKMLPS